MKRTGRKLLLMDACVLIDFIKSDKSVLGLVSRHVGKLYAPSPVVNEISDIENADELTKLGIIILEPEIEDAFSAAARIGATSFQDQICLLSAKRHGFTCVTNDKRLRTACYNEKVPTMWGLQLLAELYKHGAILKGSALEIARLIHKDNPKHITPEILNRFAKSLDE